MIRPVCVILSCHFPRRLRLSFWIMKFVLTSLLLFAGIFDVAFLRAEDTPANTLLVLAKHDNTLAIVDPSSLKCSRGYRWVTISTK